MNRLLLSALSLLSSAAAQDYFPLQVGNQWVYRATGAERRLTLEITGATEMAGHTYFRLTGLGAAYWLRLTEAGTLVALDEAQQSERVWYNFAAASYDTAIPSAGRATVISRAAAFEGPLGRLNNALELGYSGGSLVKEQLLPYIGLAYREEAGVRHELVYARVRGVNVFSSGELSFRLSLDQTVYAAGARLTAHLTFVNTTGQPVRLTFPSTQRYDLSIRDSGGNSVYHWSADKLFAQVVETVDFRGETHWVVDVPLERLRPGAYVIETWVAVPENTRWRALSRFQVAAAP